MEGVAGGTSVTPKGFSLLFLAAAGPQRQAPARAIARPHGTPSLVAPWPVPLPCAGGGGSRFLTGFWVAGGDQFPGCTHLSSTSWHARDIRADDSPNRAVTSPW